MEKERKIMEIMNLAFLINAKKEYCVFIRYSGHVDSLDITIAKNKKEYNVKIANSDRYSISNEPLGKLEKIAETLRKFLENKDGEIPKEYLITIERVELDYKF